MALGGAVVTAMLITAIVGIGGAVGSTVSSASFTGGAGTVSVGGTLYAKQGGALTLTVTTSADTKCVDITGTFAGHQTSTTAKKRRCSSTPICFRSSNRRRFSST